MSFINDHSGCTCCEWPQIGSVSFESETRTRTCANNCGIGQTTQKYQNQEISLTRTYSKKADGTCKTENTAVSGGYSETRTVQNSFSSREPDPPHAGTDYSCSDSQTIDYTYILSTHPLTLNQVTTKAVYSGGGQSTDTSFLDGYPPDTESKSWHYDADGNQVNDSGYGGGCSGGTYTYTRTPAIPSVPLADIWTNNVIIPACSLPAYPPWPSELVPPAPLYGNSFIAENSRGIYHAPRLPVPARPAANGQPAVTAVSLRGGAAEGSTQSDTMGRWRITHDPTPTCFLKVWMEITRIPNSLPNTTAASDQTLTGTVGTGGPPVKTVETYEWTGTSNPCIQLPFDPLDQTKKIKTHWKEETAINEIVFLKILKFSYFPGYDPDVSDISNSQCSGYPCPEWQPQAP